MIFKGTRKLFQKFFILGTLMACLGIFSAGAATNASTDLNNNFLPCCSFCDDHPESIVCRRGCSPSCRADQ